MNVVEGQGRVVDEHVVETRVLREYENIGEGVVVSRGNIPSRKTNTVREIEHEVPRVVEKVIEKEIPIIIENPVPREHYVDKQYDVIIEKPIERVIEKEVTDFVDKKVRKKIIETPIPIKEQVVEVKNHHHNNYDLRTEFKEVYVPP